MSAVRERNNAKSKADMPGEIEARHLLVVGVSRKDVAQITGRKPAVIAELQEHIESFGPGPYSADQAARILGIGYRGVYHAIGCGELPSRGGGVEDYSVQRRSLVAIAGGRLRKDGERKARFMLFVGLPVALAAIRGRITIKQAKAILERLQGVGAGPETTGPYTIKQAAEALGLCERQVRGYCKLERFGAGQRMFGSQYQIDRESLVAFGAQDRRYGCKASRWNG